ncbi:MAG: F0F1 ATP synthase subunit delta [Burkholderiales bacterium]|nr:F0F1 ATP synthase subunit delta [Burkholderiales bacterium]
MAELATLARPYADALFKALPASEAQSAATQLGELAQVAQNDDLRAFADNPKADAGQVFSVATAAMKTGLGAPVANLLRVVLENGRLAALPEIAAQFRALVNTQGGTQDATVYSAFPIGDAELAAVMPALEKRFATKLEAHVVIAPELIGGIRVVVGDEVLDTSVKARLEQMKIALSA